jgi:AcrR family transcriptional regulator
VTTGGGASRARERTAVPGPERTGRVGRPRGPRRSRDERRSELLDAAERAIRRIGPQASMDELAAEAGITKPILYSLFGDKAGLAAALAQRVAAVLGGAIADALSAVNDPRSAVSSTIGTFCSFIESEQALYRFLVQTTMRQPDKEARVRPVANFGHQVAEALRYGLRAVGEDESAAEPWSYAIVGMTLTAGEWWLERRTMTREDLVQYLTKLLWGGLAGAGLDRLASLVDADDPDALADVTFLTRPAPSPTPLDG